MHASHHGADWYQDSSRAIEQEGTLQQRVLTLMGSLKVSCQTGFRACDDTLVCSKA